MNDCIIASLRRFFLTAACASFTVLISACSGSTSTYPIQALPNDHSMSSAFLRQAQPQAGVESVLYSFQGGADGEFAHGPLYNLNGTLYGTTEFGGINCTTENVGCGTVYSIATSGAENVLHAFAGGADGYDPGSGLVAVNGTLYGTTPYGGTASCPPAPYTIPQGCGTVFAITPSGQESILHSFQGNSTDGAFPQAGLIYANGALYGTTSQGGSGACSGNSGILGCGTVFKITLAGQESVLYSFKGHPDGQDPVASVIDVGGALYGTTFYGGTGTTCQNGAAWGCGTVFKVTFAGAETIVHSFGGAADGANPLGGLTAVAGVLYGTTGAEGTSCTETQDGCGTVFKTTTAGQESVLHAFQGSDGAVPYPGNLLYTKGALFGTTNDGGSAGMGVLFKITTTGQETVLHSFTGGSDGSAPQAGLINVSGTLYGTTLEGGSANLGTVYTW